MFSRNVWRFLCVIFNFNAATISYNMFDKEFGPRRLRNWQVPHLYPKWPHANTGKTQIIANDRGHLLPGIPRPQKIGSGPWGHFVPTWRLPKRITREIAKELQYPNSVKKKATKVEVEKPSPVPKEASPLVKKYFDNEDPCDGLADKSDKPEPEKDLSYVPGDLTDPKYQHESYELLRPKKILTIEEIQAEEMERYRKHSVECRQKSPKNPFACVYRNFEMAKKCAKENLEHHPLPDTVTNAMFKKLQMERALAPGLALEDAIQATGVGWKGYGASGPTQCTKMRVYRPKTCAHKKLKNLDENTRPGSCGSFDLKWRFIKQKYVTPIELAICWDMTPENPSDEPKRTPHIDGSNGSAAPAVFQMVQSPKPPEIITSSRKGSCDGIHGCGTIKSSSAGSHRSRSNSFHNSDEFKRPHTTVNIPPKQISNKTLVTNNNLERLSRSISTNSLYVNLPPTRILTKETFASLKPYEHEVRKPPSPNNKIYQSSPNLSTNSCACTCNIRQMNDRPKNRTCLACHNPSPTDKEPRPKSEYKMAFKAGKLNGNTSLDGTNSSSSGTNKTYLKVPKQKDPYAKKNYDINSLHPPFSLWKGNSCQSYPEHWRLASIYQHSYKPVENRKKPLLASVFQ